MPKSAIKVPPMGLQRRMLLSLALFLAPVLLLTALYFRQQTERVRQSVYDQHRTSHEAMAAQIERMFEDVKRNQMRMVTQSQMNTFLQVKFRMSPYSLSRYRSFSAMIDIAAVSIVDVHSVALYISNTTIPEQRPYFFSLSRVREQEPISDFLASGKNSAWYWEGGGYAADTFEADASSVLVLLDKLQNEGRELGVIASRIRHATLREALRSQESNLTFALSDEQGNLLVNPGIVPPEGLYESGGIVRTQDAYWLATPLEGVPWTLVSRVRQGDTASANLPGTLVLLAMTGMVLCLIIATNLLLGKSIRRLNEIMGATREIAQGKLETRCAAEGKDEIADLARAINHLLDMLDEMTAQAIRREVAQSDAQLRMLQAQINPHFLYNTIDLLRMKLEMAGEEQAADAATDFCEILRYNTAEHAPSRRWPKSCTSPTDTSACSI